MKNPDIKKKALISGIVVLLLAGGVLLAIRVTPNGFEKFVYDATGMILDINGDGVSGLTSVYPTPYPEGYVLPPLEDDGTLLPPEGYEDF